MTSPQRPQSPRPVRYRGEPLDAARGPGLGCFWIQLIVLGALIVLTPLTVTWGAPPMVSAILLFVVIVLLLFVGQTMIFLLRLVAAGRGEGRRRPLAAASPTVGEIEDAPPEDGAPADAPQDAGAPAAPDGAPPDSASGRADPVDPAGDDAPAVRQ